MSLTDDWFTPQESLMQTIIRQTPTADGFICKGCIFYAGGVSCERNIFISTVGANMSRCAAFEAGEKCRHCGKTT